MNLIDSLAAHPEVKSRDCGDGITSFNFTRKGNDLGSPRRLDSHLAWADTSQDQ